MTRSVLNVPADFISSICFCKIDRKLSDADVLYWWHLKTENYRIFYEFMLHDIQKWNSHISNFSTFLGRQFINSIHFETHNTNGEKLTKKINFQVRWCWWCFELWSKFSRNKFSLIWRRSYSHVFRHAFISPRNQLIFHAKIF